MKVVRLVAVIKDVAGRAGLSVSVVSKYLEAPSSERSDTREKIERAIKELNYVPSTQARALRTGKTGLISIISPNITNPFFAELFSAIQSKALQLGYTAILQTIPTVQKTDNSVVSHPFAVSSSSRVDGMIICFPDEEEIVSFLRQQWKCLPMVLLSWNAAKEADANIIVDVAKGTYETTRYLLGQGHRSIGYVGAPENSATSQEKQKGYIRALLEGGMAVRPEMIFHGPYCPETGYQAAETFWRGAERPTAIITEADIFAVGCIKYCHKKNIDVPGEMAVVGFDDIPMAALYHPSITTVRLPIGKLGDCAVETLRRMLDAKDQARQPAVHFDTELIERKSTNPAYVEEI